MGSGQRGKALRIQAFTLQRLTEGSPQTAPNSGASQARCRNGVAKYRRRRCGTEASMHAVSDTAS